MKKLIYLIFIFTISFEGFFPQQNYVDGWSKIKWGMTPDEISLLYPRAIVTKEIVGLPDIYIEREKFMVTVDLDYYDRKAIGVTLFHLSTTPTVFYTPPSPSARKVYKELYNNLLMIMEGKYGKPNKKEIPLEPPKSKYINSQEFKSIWEFPNTIIDISLGLSYNSDAGILVIHYKKRNDSDKL